MKAGRIYFPAPPDRAPFRHFLTKEVRGVKYSSEMQVEPLALGHTKNQIMESAVRLFVQHGYNQTSIQQIVEGAGLTKGAFYHYFNTKEDILRAIHDSYLDVELAHAHKVLEEKLDPELTLRRLIRAMVETIISHRDRVAIIARERTSLSDTDKDVWRKKRDEFANIITSTIERGIESGDFRQQSSSRLVAFALIGMCAWTVEWYKPDGPQNAQEIGDLFGSLILAGLMAEK